MTNDVLNNYFPFYEMVKLSLLLSNRIDETPDEDVDKLINFVGKAYGLSEELVSFMKYQIDNELSAVSVTDDINAFKSINNGETKRLGEYPKLLQVKTDALNDIVTSTNRNNTKFNPAWFDYSYFRQYDAKARFAQLELASMTGYVDANKLVAIMLALGIGCEVNFEEAILRMKQCVMWADLPSIYFLKEIYKLFGDEENASIYQELSELENYFMKGVTVLPAKEDKRPQVVRELYAEISSIKHDVIYQFNLTDINYSFVEVMNSKDISYHRKLEFINNFNSYEWKEATNSSVYKMGFKLKGGN